MNTKKYLNWKSFFVYLFLMSFAVACTAAAGEGTAVDGMEHTDEEVEHVDDHEPQDEHNRVPNNGAAVHILSPADGDTFQVGDEITVEIELENFELGDGYHWHIYVDGSSWGMVLGENTDDVVRGLEAGEHEIAVYLSIDTHEELEDGDAIMIVVEE